MNAAHLRQLESKRQEILQQLITVGPFRRGTVSENYRKCGKAQCHCTEAGSRGHGPQYLWNATINGKSVAKNLRSEKEIDQYRAETEEYRKYRELSMAFIEINERICNEWSQHNPAMKAEMMVKKKR